MKEDYSTSEHKYNKEDLENMQLWDLERKIQVSQTRLIEWYMKWNGKCYVSFSGGKDSTILAYLAAQVCVTLGYKLILWFSDTGLEFPEIREHVKNFPDYLQSQFPDLKTELIITRPTYGKTDNEANIITFRDIIKKYGYPLISKEVANAIYLARNNPSGKAIQKFIEGSDYHQKYGDKWMYTKYKFLLDAPFQISAKCCTYMKRNPAAKYDRESGNKPILGIMAYESNLRRNQWYQNGCNMYNGKHPSSKPLSFWTEQDVLKFIYKYKIPLALIYGEVECYGDEYFLTGIERSGCIYCGFGCHLEKEPNRFQRLRYTHPKLWEYCMKPYDEGGLGMKEVLTYAGIKNGEEDTSGWRI